jgi:hypothetical protein
MIGAKKNYIAEGEKKPSTQLKKAAHPKNPTTKRRAQLAEALRGLKHK